MIFFLQGATEEKCQTSLRLAIELLQKLGFTVHLEKSQLKPGTILIFLGFVIDSEKMTVTLTPEKKEKLVKLIDEVLSKCQVTIRTVASLIGKFVSSLPASLYGPLHYRVLERDKNRALKSAKGNFEAKMQLSDEGKSEVLWWKENIDSMSAPIHWPPITQEISTDASGKNGWGGEYARPVAYWRCVDHGPTGFTYQCKRNDCYFLCTTLICRCIARSAC